MHFAILVEDQSGKAMLDILVPKILGPVTTHTFEVHPYKGIGHIPKGLTPKTDAAKRILLDQLPRLLAGYGKTFAGYGDDCSAAVIVVCDLDTRISRRSGRSSPIYWTKCIPLPIRLSVWLLRRVRHGCPGDIPAIKKAFPKAKDAVLAGYQNDTICGTWELLADAVYPGGAKMLKVQGDRVAGAEKSRWAREISPHMDVGINRSPSFDGFVAALRQS